MTESIIEHNDAAQEPIHNCQDTSDGGGHRSIHGRKIFMKRIKVQSCTSSWQQSKFLSEWELLVSVRVIIVWIFYWIISVNHHLWHFITRTTCLFKLLNIHGNNFHGIFQRSWSVRGTVPRIDRVYPGYFAKISYK